MKEFNEFYLLIESCHQRLEENLSCWSPKKELEHPYSEEPVIIQNYVGPHETLELNENKEESDVDDFQWDNAIPTADAQSDSDCEYDMNTFENKASVRAIIRTYTDRPIFPAIRAVKRQSVHDYRYDIARYASSTCECDICGLRYI